MKTETLIIDIQNLSSFTNERYEVISNETLSDCIHRDINVSGSLLSLSTFTNVTFIGCVFFGSKLEHCTFKNCKFIACEFKFTQIQSNIFTACEFSKNTWSSSSMDENEFRSTQIDSKTGAIATNNTNMIKDCFSAPTLNKELIEKSYFEKELLTA